MHHLEHVACTRMHRTSQRRYSYTLGVLVQRLLIKCSHRALVFHWLVHRVMDRDKGVKNNRRFFMRQWTVRLCLSFALFSLGPLFFHLSICLFYPSAFIWPERFEFKDWIENLAAREDLSKNWRIKIHQFVVNNKYLYFQTNNFVLLLFSFFFLKLWK